MARVTITDLQRMKAEKKKIVVMTAYDYSMAGILDRAHLDIILVGDSGGRNLLGHEDNNSVTMDEMVLMTRSVSRGAKRAMVIGDMPFMSYQVGIEESLRNAGRVIQEGGAQAVKLEVGAHYAPTVEAIVKAGIPVMGHMGLTPMVTSVREDFGPRVCTSMKIKCGGTRARCRPRELSLCCLREYRPTSPSASPRKQSSPPSPALAQATIATARSVLRTES